MRHYDADTILDMATGNPPTATVKLKFGETTYAPGTTKKILTGMGEYTYAIHPTGWTLTAPRTALLIPLPR